MITREEIREALDEFEYSNPGFIYDNEDLDEPRLGLKFDCEDSEGGYEGGGEHCHRVFKVTNVETKEEVYIKFDGFYGSYSGSEYEDFYIADFDLVQVKKWKKKGE